MYSETFNLKKRERKEKLIKKVKIKTGQDRPQIGSIYTKVKSSTIRPHLKVWKEILKINLSIEQSNV